jgi:uncharacterized protein YxeA
MKKVLSLLTAVAFVLTFGLAFAQEQTGAPEGTEGMKKEQKQPKKKKKKSTKKKKKAAGEEKTAPTGTM